jgi:hypothetical protein
LLKRRIRPAADALEINKPPASAGKRRQETRQSLEKFVNCMGDGERGRNRTYNLLIKSYGSRFSCWVINCSHYNNLTNTRPAWTASENVDKVGEIERHLIRKDTKKTQGT